MLKLREPFLKKVHLHIRQDLLQWLWDKYVPAASPEYGQIEMIYLKDGHRQMGRQPEQIQLLLQLIVQNKRMQISLMQYPALVKIGQKQMEKSLRKMEHYYETQLKSYDFTMFRTMKQYVTLLEQAKGGSGRYKSWLESHQVIERQREEYRQLSLFSEKLRELLTEYSKHLLRKTEKELVYSLSETEYQESEKTWKENKTERLRLQNQYLRDGIRSVQEQIPVILKQNALEKIEEIVDTRQLIQQIGKVDDTVKPADNIEAGLPLLWDGACQVLQNLEQECRIRRERIVQMQAQAFETYREAYHQVVNEEDFLLRQNLMEQKEQTVQLVGRTFRERYQKQVPEKEIRRLCEWSEAYLEVCLTKPEKMETQHVSGERPVSDWQEYYKKDERIQQSLSYIRELEEEQRNQFVKAMSDMALIWHEVLLSGQLSSERMSGTVQELSLSGKLFSERMSDIVHEVLLSGKFFSERISDTVPQPGHTEPGEQNMQEDRYESVLDRYSSVEDRYESVEDRTRLQELISQINQNADVQLVYTDTQLSQPKVQELLTYIQKLDEKTYGVLVKELSQITKLQMKSYKETEAPKLLNKEAEAVPVTTGEEANIQNQLPDISYQNLWEWGETLLFYPSADKEQQNVHSEDGTKREEASTEEETLQKEVQTETIRSQIEMAKNRNSLQRLIRQMNHKAELELVYTDAQLKQPKVQELLTYIQKLDEKTYGVLVKELSQITKLQMQSYKETKTVSAPAGEEADTVKLSYKERETVSVPAGEEADTVKLSYKETEAVAVAAEEANIQNQLPDISYQNLWEWGETLLFHSSIAEIQQNPYLSKEMKQDMRFADNTQRNAHSIAETKREESSADKAGQKEVPARMIHRQIERSACYPVLAEHIQDYEKQHRLLLHKDIRQIEQKIFMGHPELIPVLREADREYKAAPYVYEESQIENKTAPYAYDGNQMEYSGIPYEGNQMENGRTPYEEGKEEYGRVLYGEPGKANVQSVVYEKNNQERRYGPQELEYSVQSVQVSEEQLQRQKLHMQQETAKLKSVQEQLDQKLKEVEQQLKRVEGSTKGKEDVRSFAEQVKRQLYEELHVERLRRGLV